MTILVLLRLAVYAGLFAFGMAFGAHIVLVAFGL